MRSFLFGLVVPFLLGACGEGYVPPSAVIRVEFTNSTDMDAATDRAHSDLVRLGYEFMRPEDRPRVAMGDTALEDRRATTVRYWLHQRGAFDVLDLHLSVTPFRDRSRNLCGYGFCLPNVSDVEPPLRFPFVEYDLGEIRPGGFSPAGHEAYTRLMDVLSRSGGTIVIAKPPPPDNEYVHDRIERARLWTTSGWWLFAWVICAAIFGPLIALLARTLRARAVWRRIALVIAGTILVTPLPVPLMFGGLFLPAFLSGYEVLGSPTTPWGYFVIMFAASAVFFLAAALVFVRDRPFPVLDDRPPRF